jgi:pimeloyl-ACP methyl ester carboxylesterase
MRRSVASVFLVLISITALIALLLYFMQEKLIFFPSVTDKEYRYPHTNAEEVYITTRDNVRLHAVLFKADGPSKGVIFYLHGNAGAIDSWGGLSSVYNDLHYDVFMLDYRGYGKSEGSIESEKQFFSDVQLAYADLQKKYSEDKIIVLGYSIGTAAAAMVAATNQPRKLILQAPYYSLVDLAGRLYPFVPSFLLKYKFETWKYVAQCKAPIVIFHGDIDEVIYHGSSIKLQEFFKAGDTLITLKNQSHNGITENPEYLRSLTRIL